MGDGINDAPALHTADVSISVQQAADAAKAAADIVLLEQDLGVLEHGVRDGRRTFANTLKYVFMATSANFGNMFSMAGASVFLPFLPLLPKQILLMNLLTDLPELTIATDRVERGLDRSAPAMGRPVHPPVHAGLRRAQLGLRLPDVRRAAVVARRRARSSSGPAGSSSRSSRQRLIVLVVRTRTPPAQHAAIAAAWRSPRLVSLRLGLPCHLRRWRRHWALRPFPSRSWRQWSSSWRCMSSLLRPRSASSTLFRSVRLQLAP